MIFKITFVPTGEFVTASTEFDAFYALYNLAIIHLAPDDATHDINAFWHVLYDFPPLFTASYGNFVV